MINLALDFMEVSVNVVGGTDACIDVSSHVCGHCGSWQTKFVIRPCTG